MKIEVLEKTISSIKRLTLELRRKYAERGEYFCDDCGEELTSEEVENAKYHKLDMMEVLCDRCWDMWQKEKYEERRHPDEFNEDDARLTDR